MYKLLIINKTSRTVNVESLKIVPRIGEQFYDGYLANVVGVIHCITVRLLTQLDIHDTIVCEHMYQEPIDAIILIV